MPWPVRSVRFGLYNGTPAANTPVSLGTVPAGKKWLLKEWQAYNAGASSRTVVMLVNVAGVRTVIDVAAAVPSANPAGNSNRHFVLNTGETLEFQTSVAQAIHITASGAQLG